MTTIRQLERFWEAKQYDRMLSECLGARPEGFLANCSELAGAVAAGAMGIIRLDELAQPQSTFCTRLIHRILASQRPDGSWGDVMLTALCLRALLCSRGNGVAVDRGLKYLADLQKPEGTWPRVPVQRFPGDALVSAFVLLQLADQPVAVEALRLGEAMQWLLDHETEMDQETSRLWRSVSSRCRGTLASRAGPAVAMN